MIDKDYEGSGNLLRELWWTVRHGSWRFGRNRTGCIIDCGRTWYDGPIWFANVGPFAVSICVR